MVPDNTQTRRRILALAGFGIASSLGGCVQSRQEIGVSAGGKSQSNTPTPSPTPTPQQVPYFDGWLTGVDNYEFELVDRRGQDNVIITTGAAGNGGNFAFSPPAVQITPDTTVKWRWTGKGAAHNVYAKDGSFKSGTPVDEPGIHFTFTFENAGVHKYYCQPHKALDMKGVVVVGDDYPTAPRSEVAKNSSRPNQSDDPADGKDTSTPTGPYDGYLSDVNNFDGTVVDKTGQSPVSIAVGAEGNGGNYAFEPPAVSIDTGSTIVWDWTGNGGAHNIVAEGGAFDSGSPATDADYSFEQSFENTGIYKYYCAPHKALGMKGVIEVVNP